MVAHRSALAIELLHDVAEPVERRVVVEVAGHEPDALCQLLPDVLAELGAGVLLHRVVDDLLEVLVGPVATGEPDEREARRQQSAVGEVVDRRHQLLARQVARHAEDDEARRAGDAVEPVVLRGAERVVRRGDRDRLHASSFESQPTASSSVATFAAGSVSVRVSTGRPWSASTLASPDGLCLR